LRTVFGDILSSRTICRIGLRSTKNAGLIRPIVSTVTIPGHALPSTTTGRIRRFARVGPYSTLFITQAGSLFHAVFTSDIKAKAMGLILESLCRRPPMTTIR
jgi:hypothetical protein